MDAYYLEVYRTSVPQFAVDLTPMAPPESAPWYSAARMLKKTGRCHAFRGGFIEFGGFFSTTALH